MNNSIFNNRSSENNWLKFFYSSKLSKYPVRDVTNSQGQNHKTEPHIEVGADNFLSQCNQKIIKSAVLNGSNYFFYFTNCKNRNLPFYNRKFIVGYLKILDKIEYNQIYCALGKPYFVSYEEGIDIEKELGYSRTMRHKKISQNDFEYILGRLSDGTNITEILIDEISRLDEYNPIQYKTCLLLQNKDCFMKDYCIRYKKYLCDGKLTEK